MVSVRSNSRSIGHRKAGRRILGPTAAASESGTADPGPDRRRRASTAAAGVPAREALDLRRRGGCLSEVVHKGQQEAL
uniref:Uncharacterized protein n=1 Tax=uncultured prokaryote TaxID=198431 RepID=A0A0H5QJI0_9ZZZZ|nr:hypothetical protein [uncultured prokaryote]